MTERVYEATETPSKARQPAGAFKLACDRELTTGAVTESVGLRLHVRGAPEAGRRAHREMSAGLQHQVEFEVRQLLSDNAWRRDLPQDIKRAYAS